MSINNELTETHNLRKQSSIRVSKNELTRNVLSKIMKTLGFFALGVFVIYLIFASTVVRFLPMGGDSGFLLVKEPTFKTGTALHGEDIVVSLTEKNESTILENLKRSFTVNDDAVVIKVFGGPLGDLKWSNDGQVAVDGNIVSHIPVGYKVDKEYLSEEYIGVCVSGNCQIGELVIVPIQNVLGVPVQE